jgi:hypothetical protein
MTDYISYIIPILNTDNSPSFIERIKLDDVYYDLKFDWNNRDECWILTLSLPDGAIIIGGIKMVINYELIAQHKIEQLPEGSLMLFDVTNTLNTCGFYDLGNNCVLTYTKVS